MSQTLPIRFRNAYRWRAGALRQWLYRQLIPLGGEWFIRLRWPWPLRKPWQRSRLRILAPGGGLGDELLCLPVFRAIKERNPACHITFVVRNPLVFEGNSYLDEVESYSLSERPRGLQMGYHYLIPPPRPFITLMAECVGLSLHATRLEKPPATASPRLEEEIAAIGSPRIVIQPLSSRWTKNKNWPTDLWIRLVNLLTQQFEVIEVGSDTELPADLFGPRFRSFAGKTDVLDLAHIISKGDFFIGPPSGGMHIANAFDIPSAVIFGGYESPDGYAYSNVIPFYTPVECAPCWLATPCPYGKKCLTAVRPEAVYEVVCKSLERAAATGETQGFKA